MAQTETQTDMPISMLSMVLKVKPGDLFFLEQSGEGKALTAQVLETWLMEMAEGHGGVVDFQKTGTSGLEDTYTFTMSDATPFSFTVRNGEKGATGEKGEKGDTGLPASIRLFGVDYQASDSGTIVPSGSWTRTVPEVPQGKFLWTRIALQFNTGSPITAYSVTRYGIDGAGAVSTVNRKSPDSGGNVQLAAGDVGARPNDWVPSASDITAGILSADRLPIVPVSKGGTGSTTAAQARSNLEITPSIIGAIPADQKGAGDGVATLNNKHKVTPEQASADIVFNVGTRAFQLNDAGKLLMVQNSSGADTTLTIPANSAVQFPVGTEIEVCRGAQGKVSISAEDGITVFSVDNARQIGNIYGIAVLKKLTDAQWILAGDIE